MSQLEHKAALLRRTRRVVVKIGSNLLASATGLRAARINALAAEIVALIDQKRDAIVVSSGAVAAGRQVAGPRKPTLEWRQAAAALGQPTLMASYERALRKHGRHAAQVLLTHGDLADRRRYLNARHTMRTLLAMGAIPIVNENDTVATEELAFGDNDRLAALTATLIEADLLIILSDVDGLYERDPRLDAKAPLIPVARADDARLAPLAGPSRTGVGTGGMASKLAAARIAADAGIPTVIAGGARRGVVGAVLDPTREIGTLFLAGDRLGSRKHWIVHTLRPAGTLRLDAGAERALAQGGRSLLPSGVVAVEGKFGVGDCVVCVGPSGKEIARGLVSYASVDLARIAGAHTREIEQRLGWKGSDEVIHRDDLAVVTAGRAAS